MAKPLLEYTPVVSAVSSVAETFQQGLEMANMIDALNLDLYGKKTQRAKAWRREFGKLVKTGA